MKKALLLSLLLLLHGCSFESILALGEVDKVEVVKKNASLSHYRAYFTRSNLQPITKKRKYLYFYNHKKRDLAILLHRYGNYYLYSLYHPEQQTLTIYGKPNLHYAHVKKILRKKGYYPSYPAKVGATSKVALRRYKGIKTLLVEVRDYSRLLAKYKEAIKTYNPEKIKHLQTKLPHSLIAPYYYSYYRQTTDPASLEALHIIAQRLGLETDKEEQSETEKLTQERVEHQVQTALAKEIPEPISSIPFSYYANEASLHEIESYLAKQKTKDELSFNQYTILKKRQAKLREKELLKKGSLEELITIYKKNKDPRYKKRILQLMKEAQS